MSRRKQANPRPLITVVGERGGEEDHRETSLSPSPSIPESESEQDLPDCDSVLVIDTSGSVFPSSRVVHPSVTPGMTQPMYPDASPSVSIIPPCPVSSTPSETSRPPSPLAPPANPSSLSTSYSYMQPDLSKKSIQKILPVSLEDGNSCFICPVCQKELTTSHELTIHIRSHNTSSLSAQANTCTICGKILSSQSSLDRHMLVHSGERPFKCKICKMSFTTNGNMHRHSRIHKKDDPTQLGVKPGPRKSKAKMFTKPEIHPALLPTGVHMDKFLHGAGLESQFGLGVMKPVSTILPDLTFSRLPMVPSVSMMHGMYKGDHSQVFVKREPEVPVAVSAPLVSAESQDGDTECPVCQKAFLSEADLESHLNSHPHPPAACTLCTLVLPDHQSLCDHKTKQHPAVTDVGSSSEQEAQEAVMSGFFDLDFVNFSVSKFPLIAKSWCERNGRPASSSYHNFVCPFCSKAFPCKSALFLHMFIHNRKQLSTCPFCDCDFVGGAILHTHMLKHMSDAAISEAAPTVPHDIGKDHFLASLGIAAKKNLTEVLEVDHGLSKNSNWLSNLEKRENVEYFEKLGQCYVPSVHSDIPERPPVLGSETGSQFLAKNVKQEFLKEFSDFQNMVYLQAVAEGLPKDGVLPLWSPARAVPPRLPVPSLHPSLIPTPHTSPVEPLAPGVLDDGLTLPGDEGQSGVDDSMADASCLKNDASSPVAKDVFPCKFCDMVFSNYRALKGHTRTHLGLSPYKCNLCNYSSADKSTLIRHLRTHNGERPFQCLVCDFAFTTKANCERHVRKKHGKVMKQDIEASIGYNKYVLESPSLVDSFHSPDTICKYCGIDFKFFRALKHHLRSHSSCRLKPFLCQKCDVGFSTKANCVRHLQKQHPEISQHHIENWIHVNEPSLLEDGEQGFSDGRDSVSPTESYDNTGVCSPSPSPPIAHHSPVMERLCLKQESDSDTGQPLDFSVKPFGQGSVPSTGQFRSEDQPIDLSVKKLPNESSYSDHTVNTKSELTSLLTSTHSLDKRIQEQSLPLELNNNNNQKLNNLLSLSDNNNNNHHKFWGMASLLNAPTPLIGYPQMGGGVLSQSLPARMKAPAETKIHSAFFRSFNQDNMDLASVNKIIYNTSDMKNLQSYFHPSYSGDNDPEMDDVMSCSSSGDLHCDSRSDTPASPDTNEGEATEMGSGEDNSQEQQLEMIIKGETTPNGSLSPYGKQAAREEKRSDNTHDQSPPDSVGGDSPGGAPADLATPVKKKRNSYADSPHKLSCPCCPRSFPWISSLNRHLLTHTGQKPFKCPRCPVTFSTKSNRERHLIRKHGVNMLDPASRQTMDRPYKCHLCVFSSFATESNLLKHYQERHKGEKPSAESYLNLESSALSCTFSDNEGGDEFDISQTPGGSTGTNGSDEEDSKSVSNMRDPTTNSVQTESSEPMEVDQNGNLSEGFNTDIKSEIKSADMSTSLVDDEDDSLDLTAYSPDWKKTQINPERDNYNVDKITQCWKCGLEFPLRKLLVRHLKDHNIDLPFKCYLCDASYDKRQDCLQHQERFHPQDWGVLKDKNGVDSVDRFSTRMDKLVEKHCQGAVLQGPEKPGGCVDEDREDSGPGLEEGLMDSVTSDYQQRKVYCSLCPKRFWSLQDLRRHMRSHTGERPFECDVCFKRFTLKHSMMRHRKKHVDSATPPLSDDEDNNVNSDDNVSSLLGKTALRFHLTNQNKASDNNSQVTSSSVSVRQCPQPSLSSNSDLLHNLLGVEVSTIDKMLNSADSADSAAQMLGVK